MFGNKPVAAAAPPDEGDPLMQRMRAIKEMFGGQSQGGSAISPEVIKLLMGEPHVDVQGQYNKGSQLPSGSGNKHNPWNSGFFKPMDKAFADTGARPGTAIPAWANPGSARFNAETIQQPNAWGSSFVPGSGDIMGEGGMATGRISPFGSSIFGSPQAPTGQRLLAEDPALMAAANKPKAKTPFSFGASAKGGYRF